MLAAWPNGKALDYDNWNQEIAGSIPAVVTQSESFFCFGGRNQLCERFKVFEPFKLHPG
jgi:hypothetical protein